jgi:hypothetical protein
MCEKDYVGTNKSVSELLFAFWVGSIYKYRIFSWLKKDIGFSLKAKQNLVSFILVPRRCRFFYILKDYFSFFFARLNLLKAPHPN